MPLKDIIFNPASFRLRYMTPENKSTFRKKFLDVSNPGVHGPVFVVRSYRIKRKLTHEGVMDIKRRITQLESRIGAGPGGIDPRRFKTFNDFFVWHTRCQSGEINPTDQEAAQVQRAWDQFAARGRWI